MGGNDKDLDLIIKGTDLIITDLENLNIEWRITPVLRSIHGVIIASAFTHTCHKSHSASSLHVERRKEKLLVR